MSDVSIGGGNKATSLWVDDIGSNTLDRAQKLLAGIPGGVGKAVGSALKRAASSGEAYAARALRKEYVVKASDYKEYTTSKRHIDTDASGATEVSLEFHGYHIPLIRFDATFGKDGRITARVRKDSAKQTLENAFAAKLGDRTGIYERIGDKRFPIRQFWGPSTTQMMDSNDDVAEDIATHIRDTFDKRIEHEITRVLNGWGGKQ